GIAEAKTWTAHPCASFANLFAFAAVRWTISLPETAIGYLWAWVENQTTAAMKLIPLGQSAGQRLLSRAIEIIPAAVQQGLQIADDEIGTFAPGLALASARHETQYTRLFRS
ncbi:MAG: urease accessory protein UreF, partial [Gammaproteobacteria bacterium]|nr:urease accessory protein UreF [Gammaproteobacteria bacterium]